MKLKEKIVVLLFFDGGPKKTTPSFHDPFKKTNIAEAHGDGRSEMVRTSGVFFSKMGCRSESFWANLASTGGRRIVVVICFVVFQ